MIKDIKLDEFKISLNAFYPDFCIYCNVDNIDGNIIINDCSLSIDKKKLDIIFKCKNCKRLFLYTYDIIPYGDGFISRNFMAPTYNNNYFIPPYFIGTYNNVYSNYSYGKNIEQFNKEESIRYYERALNESIHIFLLQTIDPIGSFLANRSSVDIYNDLSNTINWVNDKKIKELLQEYLKDKKDREKYIINLKKALILIFNCIHLKV